MAKGKKTGGRKKGVKNKRTLKFRDLLEKHSVNFEEQLAQAIVNKDVDLIKALKDLLPYLQPRIAAEEKQDPPDSPQDELPESEADLIRLVKNE